MPLPATKAQGVILHMTPKSTSPKIHPGDTLLVFCAAFSGPYLAARVSIRQRGILETLHYVRPNNPTEITAIRNVVPCQLNKGSSGCKVSRSRSKKRHGEVDEEEWGRNENYA